MPTRDEVVFENYWSVVLRAGQYTTRDELLSLIQANAEALDEGALATMRLLVAGSVHMENVFTVLDSAKAIATKQLMHRAAAARAGIQVDQILSRPDPGQVSSYLKSKPHRTAIVSLHFIGRDRLAILVAANAPTGSGITGFGDVHYDCVWLDGIQERFADEIEEYAHSVNRGAPNHDLIRPFFDFIGSAIFHLLWRPKPVEVIFIPHKLLHVLPLHAISFEDNSHRVYLHDMAQSIHYASSFEELATSTFSFKAPRAEGTLRPRFLSVLDTQASLPGVVLEERCIDVYRELLEPKGVGFDVVVDPEQLPSSQRDYIWANWSSHGKSSANNWGDSFLTLGGRRIDGYTIATDWRFDLQPGVVLAACESAIDTSGAFQIDEHCGLDLAFRIAGARAVVGSLWVVDDLLAALTALLVPAWWFQGRMLPSHSLTALQQALRTATWKSFLLSDDQLRRLPQGMSIAMQEVQAPFWKLRADAFAAESLWGAFRSHGD